MPRATGKTEPPHAMDPNGLGPGCLLFEQGAPVLVSVTKTEAYLGLALWQELPERAVVHLVRSGTAAAEAGLSSFDELLSINGAPCESARHAARAIRDAPPGAMRLRVSSCPVRLVEAAEVLQRVWMRALFARRGLVRARLCKPAPTSRLGLDFSADFPCHAVVSAVAPSASPRRPRTLRLMRGSTEACGRGRGGRAKARGVGSG